MCVREHTVVFLIICRKMLDRRSMSFVRLYTLCIGCRTHAANHYDMLQNVARDEWGFEGFIMTDWYTSQDTTALGMVSESGKYSYSDGVQCIKAGNDLQMPGCRKNVEDIVDGVKNGRITKADLQRCAKHILGIALKTI